MPELSEIHNLIESRLNNITEFDIDDLEQIDWAMYTVIHQQAINNDIVNLDQTDRNAVFKVVLDNLI